MRFLKSTVYECACFVFTCSVVSVFPSKRVRQINTFRENVTLQLDSIILDTNVLKFLVCDVSQYCLHSGVIYWMAGQLWTRSSWWNMFRKVKKRHSSSSSQSSEISTKSKVRQPHLNNSLTTWSEKQTSLPLTKAVTVTLFLPFSTSQ